jgi:hypothetical protein
MTDDPRLSGEYVRRLSGEGADAVLIGVVHDHPTSTHRVRTVVEEVDPDVLALELPPLAVPLFERYAAGGRTPPAFGGEMSAAIQAAATDRVAGVDGPTPGFLARLTRILARKDAALSTARTVLGGLASATKHALVCRIAAGVAARTGVRLEVDAPVAHDCDRSDDPKRQAADERAQIRRARTVMNALEPADSDRFRKVAREAHMADRLSALRREGTVAAVVGIGHFDPLVGRLDGEPTRLFSPR